jgi:hypothetical protein
MRAVPSSKTGAGDRGPDAYLDELVLVRDAVQAVEGVFG